MTCVDVVVAHVAPDAQVLEPHDHRVASLFVVIDHVSVGVSSAVDCVAVEADHVFAYVSTSGAFACCGIDVVRDGAAVDRTAMHAVRERVDLVPCEVGVFFLFLGFVGLGGRRWCSIGFGSSTPSVWSLKSEFGVVQQAIDQCEVLVAGVDVSLAGVAPERKVGKANDHGMLSLLVMAKHVLIDMAPAMHLETREALHVLTRVPAFHTSGIGVQHHAVFKGYLLAVAAVSERGDGKPARVVDAGPIVDGFVGVALHADRTGAFREARGLHSIVIALDRQGVGTNVVRDHIPGVSFRLLWNLNCDVGLTVVAEELARDVGTSGGAGKDHRALSAVLPLAHLVSASDGFEQAQGCAVFKDSCQLDVTILAPDGHVADELEFRNRVPKVTHHADHEVIDPTVDTDVGCLVKGSALEVDNDELASLLLRGHGHVACGADSEA